jgi:hypothetical protein
MRIQICIILGSRIRIRIILKAGSESAFVSKFRSFRCLKWSHERPWKLTMQAWNFVMEPGGSVDYWSQIRLRIRIWIRNKVKIDALK